MRASSDFDNTVQVYCRFYASLALFTWCLFLFQNLHIPSVSLEVQCGVLLIKRASPNLKEAHCAPWASALQLLSLSSCILPLCGSEQHGAPLQLLHALSCRAFILKVPVPPSALLFWCWQAVSIGTQRLTAEAVFKEMTLKAWLLLISALLLSIRSSVGAAWKGFVNCVCVRIPS